jgi:hypothetical protein
MKEDAVGPSYFNFFQRAWQKRPFLQLRLLYVAVGCIAILQADSTTKLFDLVNKRGF